MFIICLRTSATVFLICSTYSGSVKKDVLSFQSPGPLGFLKSSKLSDMAAWSVLNHARTLVSHFRCSLIGRRILLSLSETVRKSHDLSAWLYPGVYRDVTLTFLEHLFKVPLPRGNLNRQKYPNFSRWSNILDTLISTTRVCATSRSCRAWFNSSRWSDSWSAMKLARHKQACRQTGQMIFCKAWVKFLALLSRAWLTFRTSSSLVNTHTDSPGFFCECNSCKAREIIFGASLVAGR